MTPFSEEPGALKLEVPAPSATAPYVVLLGVTGGTYVKRFYEVASYRVIGNYNYTVFGNQEYIEIGNN
ncbi:hypothetical protein [Paraflavitalea speifideaquila]|uniref:hypothetical protein n=1 Tax=Paraflavitalea speifideaquila TaxID=3076558 RepID=UPI0028E3D00D|nr:hypothetical protein [Paraflavitalea speifideiaquila]